MYILKSEKNLGSPNGLPMPGDVIVSGDFRKTYLVGPDGSHRKVDAEDHLEAVRRVKEQIATGPARRTAAEELANKVQHDLDVAEKQEQLRREARAGQELLAIEQRATQQALRSLRATEDARLARIHNKFGRAILGYLGIRNCLYQRFWPYSAFRKPEAATK